jgi:multimeric flavodoxin WrbA
MYKEMENPSAEIKDPREKIKNAEGYLAVTPEYNHSTSAAMKNTLDYFLEEYFFKPSAMVSYSVGALAGSMQPSIFATYLLNLERLRYRRPFQYQRSMMFSITQGN